MNTSISAVADLELRKHVERAVRPVRATGQRKMKMREELLAHLNSIYAEEIERNVGEEGALVASCRRFGLPTEITMELNRSVGAVERWGWGFEAYERHLDRLFSKDKSESLIWYVSRSVAAITLVTLALFGSVFGTVWLVTGEWPDMTTTIFLPKLMAMAIVGECTALFVALCVEGLTARARGVRRWLAMLFLTAAWSGLLTGASAIFWWSISIDPPSPAFVARLGLEIFAVVGVMIVVVAYVAEYLRPQKEIREAWTKLEIGE